jgi:hypothetical protein
MKMALAPWRANWWAEARPMPITEFAPARSVSGLGGELGKRKVPVMMMTLSLTLLRGTISMGYR